MENTEESLSLRDILDTFLVNWKWFILSTIVCVCGAYLYLATKSSVYQRQAVMLVKDDSADGGMRRSVGGTDALMQLNGVMMGSSVVNEIYILQSYQLVQEVVKKLRLDVIYSCEQGLRTVSLYDVKPFEVQFLDDFVSPTTFKVEVLSEKECRIFGTYYKQNVDGEENEEMEYNAVVPFDKIVETPFGRIALAGQQKYIADFIGEDISVTRIGLEAATNACQGRISTSEVAKGSTLVRIACTDTNIQRADDILAALLDSYKQSIIEDKNKIAQSTASFIGERIVLINKDLNEIEGRLAQFKQTHKLVDVEQNARIYMDQARVARERNIQLESKLGVSNYVLEFLKDNSKGTSLIPAIAGVGDAASSVQIEKYNELMLQRNRLAENSSNDNALVKEMDERLSQMRVAIIASMNGHIAAIKVQLADAKREEAKVMSTLYTVPEKEKQVLDIAREQAIKETLYTYLLQKREETALQLAITEANIRIVEHPFGSRAPIAPRRSITLLVGLVLGLGLPFAFFWVKSMLNMGVRGRKDVEAYTSIPVLGEIPHRRGGFEENAILVSEQSDEPITEAFRMLRFSMDFVMKDARVVMFTSTTPSEGKTFVSRNFAVTLAMTGKRVLLMDTDIRKRTQSRLSGGIQHEGLTSYLSGANLNLKELIIPKSAALPVDFMPAGIMPPNPAELLMSPRMDECVAKLKEQYDY
ncbi:MAG: capsid assembly protein, partial [Paraprevotella sp.]|nr:capsid assembly protein [Paraprevotella sp.]